MQPAASSDDDPATKRPRRYSLDPDLAVEVEGETFWLHAHTLMAASPVFHQMLVSGMSESLDGRIVLPGKLKEEFRQVLGHLDTLGGREPPAVTAESSLTLLRWADEYQMEVLKCRVEQFYLTTQEKDLKALKLAVDYRMEALQHDCVAAISRDVIGNRQALQEYADHIPVMELLWPAIFKAAGLPEPEGRIEGQPTIQMLWPLISRAVEANHERVFQCADEARLGARVRLFRTPPRDMFGLSFGFVEMCVGHCGVVMEKNEEDKDDVIRVKFIMSGTALSLGIRYDYLLKLP
eukprot:TRINITY_DN25673_c0_g1_i1.p1 TRINITY_DN25673_c0_g1~~TRINITY_DN25673_c0_g1_i1.p1  ORF type:complete len:293 (+),score=51.95 TRINITY_DN25673_c0_g1_i1:105-983(+)